MHDRETSATCVASPHHYFLSLQLRWAFANIFLISFIFNFKFSFIFVVLKNNCSTYGSTIHSYIPCHYVKHMRKIRSYLIGFGFGLWCLMPLSTIFQLKRGSQFYWWRKLEYSEKTTDLSKVADKLYHIMLYQVQISSNRFRTRNFLTL